MRKSGLQKQIASIFNDVPMPEQEPKSLSLLMKMQGADSPMPEAPQGTVSSESAGRHQAPRPQDTAQTPAAVQAPAVHTPAVSKMRPRPLARTEMSKPKQKTTDVFARQIKKALYGSESRKMDPRQKKMTILVGVLVMVFAGVLVLTLGGMGEKKGKTKEKAPETTSADAVQAQPLRQWQTPEPLPAQMRDPMSPQEHKPEPDEQTAQQPGQLTVRGIVFSRNNPSAIVNDQIVRQGQMINGVKVLTIHKNGIEFEQGDKRWTQPVQR